MLASTTAHPKFEGPVNRLPGELLLTILDVIFLAEWDENTTSQGTSRVPCAPFVLGEVCRSWYQIIQETSPFWSRLSLTFIGSSTDESHFRFLEYCLPRSGTFPLSIRIQQNHSQLFNIYHHNDYAKAFARVMDILAPHSGRWRHIDLYLPGCPPCPSLGSIKDRLPSLESLKIQMSSVRLHLRPTELGMFATAPRLRQIDYPVMSDKLKLRIDWSTVTSFTCKAIAFNDAVEILGKAVNLVRCSIAVFYYTPGHLVLPSITLIALRYLALRENCRFSQSPLLNLLTVPNLTVLVTNARNASTESITSFLARSSCNPMILTEDRRGGSLLSDMEKRLRSLICEFDQESKHQLNMSTPV